MDKNQFYEDTKMFFQDGILTQIYETENFCICNMCNAAYVVYDFGKVAPGQSHNGLIASVNQVKEMIADEAFYVKWVTYLAENNKWQELSMPLNDRSYVILSEFKRKADLSGPTNGVDLEFEASIKASQRRNM